MNEPIKKSSAAKAKQWAVWIVATIAVVALVLFIHARIDFSWEVFGQQLKQADWQKFVIAIAMIYGAYVLRAFRWTIFLRPVKKVSPFALIGSQVIGFTGVALFGRLADLVRPYLIARRVKLTVGSQIAVYTVERMFDGGSMALIFSLALFFAPDRQSLPHHELMNKTAEVGFAGTIGLVLFAVAVRLSGGALAIFTEKKIGSLSPGIGKSVGDKIRSFRDGLDTLDSFRDFLLVLGISLIMWSMIVFAYIETMRAFVGSPELTQMTLARCMVVMAAGMVGSIFQAPVIGWFTTIGASTAALHGWLGVPQEPATGAAAMLLVVSFLSIVPVGLIWSRFEHVSLKSVAVESEHTEEEFLLGHTPIVEESTVPPSV